MNSTQDPKTDSHVTKIRIEGFEMPDDFQFSGHTYFGHEKDYEWWGFEELLLRLPDAHEHPTRRVFTKEEALAAGSSLLDFILHRTHRFLGWIVLVSHSVDLYFHGGCVNEHRQQTFKSAMTLMGMFGMPSDGWEYICHMLSERNICRDLVLSMWPPIIRSVVNFSLDYFTRQGVESFLSPEYLCLEIESRTDQPLHFVYMHIGDQVPFMLTTGLSVLQIEGMRLMSSEVEVRPGFWERGYYPYSLRLHDGRGSILQPFVRTVDYYFENYSYVHKYRKCDYADGSEMLVAVILDVAIPVSILHQNGLVFQDIRVPNLGMSTHSETREKLFHLRSGHLIAKVGHLSRTLLHGYSDIRCVWEKVQPHHDVFALGLLILVLAWAIGPM